MGLLSLGRGSKEPTFHDTTFQPGQALHNKAAQDSGLVWRRVPDICATHDVQPRLFKGRPIPSHIKQGRLGDCWLLCALACLSCQPGALEQCFKQRKVSQKGKYTVRLFSCGLQQWVDIVIDDWLPCVEATGKLAYARTVDGSVWVPLLEKAMAKFAGGYGLLNGGCTAWALQTLTGRPCSKFRYDEACGRWRRHELVHAPMCSAPTFRLARTRCCIDSSAMFRLLLREFNAGGFVAASSGKSMQALQPGSGIRPGHAYAVTKLLEIPGTRLVRLWVPAGDGRWPDSLLPLKTVQNLHPNVDEVLDEGAANGMFWMTWSDFCRYFYTLELCRNTEDLDGT